jgi:hypothetical protein
MPVPSNVVRRFVLRLSVMRVLILGAVSSALLLRLRFVREESQVPTEKVVKRLLLRLSVLRAVKPVPEKEVN